MLAGVNLFSVSLFKVNLFSVAGVGIEALDCGSNLCHLGFEIFVTAIEVVNATDGRFAFGDEACEYERCAGAEVGTHDVCTFEREAALDGCRVAVQLDGCAQAFEFCDMLEAVVIDGVLHEAVARNGEERCHERSLHVRRESREGEGGETDGLEFLLACIDFGPVGTDVHLAADFAESVERGGDVFRDDARDFDATACDGGGAEERAGFDAVRDCNACARAERFYALDGEGARAAALNFCAHACEEVDEVIDFGFEGGVLQDAYAFGEGCRHEDVDGRTDAGNWEVEVASGEATFAGGFHIAVRDVNLCAECFEALEVQVNRARTPGASAGERDAATSEAGNERAEYVKAGAHGLDKFVRSFEVIDTAGVDSQGVASAVDVATDNAEHIGHGLHVFQMRNVRNF